MLTFFVPLATEKDIIPSKETDLHDYGYFVVTILDYYNLPTRQKENKAQTLLRRLFSQLKLNFHNKKTALNYQLYAYIFAFCILYISLLAAATQNIQLTVTPGDPKNEYLVKDSISVTCSVEVCPSHIFT